MALAWWRVGSFEEDQVRLSLLVDDSEAAGRINAVEYKNATSEKSQLVIRRTGVPQAYELALSANRPDPLVLDIPAELRPSLQAISVELRWPAPLASPGLGAALGPPAELPG